MPKSSYETQEASPGWIVAVAVAMVVGAGVMQGSLRGMFRACVAWQQKRIARDYPPSAEPKLLAERGLPPEPRLQRDSRADFERYHADQLRLLESYQWIDKKAGIARIPIDRAMEILSHGG